MPLPSSAHENILSTIGNTPLVRLNSVASHLKCTVLAKVEYFNPGGSVKDRIGPAIIAEAEASGRLKPGGTIVEATSGNTGVGLAITAALKGYKTIFVLPDKMSQEKIDLLRAYGAKVVVTPTAVEPEDPRSYYSVSKRLADETPNAILANQYHNPENPKAHYIGTGPELWAQTEGMMTHFIAGMGTGGTISGTGKYLKEKDPNIKIVGVDPIGSILYELHKSGEYTKAEGYKTEGIGEDFLPSTTDLSIVDEIVQVEDKENFVMTRRLTREEGIFAGVSCGAAVVGALRYCEQHDLGEDDVVVVVLPDSGSRYLSKAFNDNWMEENGFLEREKSAVSAIDIQNNKPDQELIVAKCTDRMADVVELLKAHNISQLPVTDDNEQLIGIVSEINLLNHLLYDDHEHTPDETIESMVETDVPVVSQTTSADDLVSIFKGNDVAVIIENQKIEGILTKIDMLDYMSSQIQ